MELKGFSTDLENLYPYGRKSESYMKGFRLICLGFRLYDITSIFLKT